MNYRPVQVGFQLSSFKFYPALYHMVSHALSSVFAHIKRPIFWKLPGPRISNMNFLIADMISFVSGTMITFSQGVQQKSNLSSFQSLAPGL